MDSYNIATTIVAFFGVFIVVVGILTIVFAMVSPFEE